MGTVSKDVFSGGGGSGSDCGGCETVELADAGGVPALSPSLTPTKKRLPSGRAMDSLSPAGGGRALRYSVTFGRAAARRITISMPRLVVAGRCTIAAATASSRVAAGATVGGAAAAAWDAVFSWGGR